MGLFSGLIGAAGGGAYGYFNGPRGQGDIGNAMKYGLIGGLGGYAAPHLIKAGKSAYGAGRNYVNKEIAIAKGGNKVLASNQAPAAAAPAAEQYTARRSAKNIMQNKVRRYKAHEANAREMGGYSNMGIPVSNSVHVSGAIRSNRAPFAAHRKAVETTPMARVGTPRPNVTMATPKQRPLANPQKRIPGVPIQSISKNPSVAEQLRSSPIMEPPGLGIVNKNSPSRTISDIRTAGSNKAFASNLENNFTRTRSPFLNESDDSASSLLRALYAS